MEIVWSETSLETFFKVVDYLFEHWTLKEIQKFETSVDELLEKITTNNELCPQSEIFGYRKCIIDTQNALVYSIINNKIFLVTFIDTRSQTIF
jgi:plasmid stabilization system protein ParE